MMSLMRILRWLTLSAACLAATLPALAEDSDDPEAFEESEAYADDDADADPSALTVYREKLSPYGRWVDTEGHGTVWVPHSNAVGDDFSPYVSNGHWELTEDGDWLWVSGYDWGYIPFHYGRWLWLSDFGWSWIPGRTYAPAWVTWRVGPGGYLGWAPFPAAYYWINGYAVWQPYSRVSYVFVHTDHVWDRHVHQRVIHDRDEVHRAADSTRRYDANRSGSARQLRSPSLKDAHLDVNKAPKAIGKRDPRTTALSSAPMARKASASSPTTAGAQKPRRSDRGAPKATSSDRVNKTSRADVNRPTSSAGKLRAPKESRSRPAPDEASRDSVRHPKAAPETARTPSNSSQATGTSPKASNKTRTSAPRASAHSRKSPRVGRGRR